jgi:MscS family membrane protein
MALLQRLGHPNFSAALGAYRRPVFYCTLAIGAALCVSLLPFTWLHTGSWPTYRHHILAIVIILLLAWGGFSTCKLIPQFLSSLGDRFHYGTGKALTNFTTRVCQVLVGLIAVSMIFSEMGYSIAGVLTGLGLGGLSFALAGQELIENFFGGIVLILERPFEIGDFITTTDVEGVVEDIALRSTRIRTMENTLSIVPNSRLTTNPITNCTRMNMRLCKFTLGLEYTTPRAKIIAVTNAVTHLLKNHPNVHADTVQVYLTEFGSSSLNVTVQCYTTVTKIADFRAVREGINLSILSLLEREGVGLAFPSQSVYFATPLQNQNSTSGGDSL